MYFVFFTHISLMIQSKYLKEKVKQGKLSASLIFKCLKQSNKKGIRLELFFITHFNPKIGLQRAIWVWTYGPQKGKKSFWATALAS